MQIYDYKLKQPMDSTIKMWMRTHVQKRGREYCIQNSVAFLLVNSKLVDKVMRKSNSFVIPSKIKKFLRINLAKEVGTLYSKY